jgi:hypothetical protein
MNNVEICNIYRLHGDALHVKRLYDQALAIYQKTIDMDLPLESNLIIGILIYHKKYRNRPAVDVDLPLESNLLLIGWAEKLNPLTWTWPFSRDFFEKENLSKNKKRRGKIELLDVQITNTKLLTNLLGSYVITKFLDAHKIGHIASYLKKLHEDGRNVERG